MKPETFSEAILCGYKKVGGQQNTGWYCTGPDTAPFAVCVYGAANLCMTGSATKPYEGCEGDAIDFFLAWGLRPEELNDEGMPWEELYGMARAAGL